MSDILQWSIAVFLLQGLQITLEIGTGPVWK